ncbi:MAG: hypothetical protein CM15mL4_1370 [uncultured marine virus]|nr:MAG: hypothetical protein CM15mL4_1370 [uncultured marine virus]
MSMTVDANTSTGSAANAFIFTKSKHTYWNGYGFQSSHGHIGAIVGKRDSAGTSDQEIRIEIGGTHINQSEERTWTFRNGGNFAVSDGNIELASGHGIDFSATANSSGSMGNELFSDYEQGSWSPTLTSGTATWYNQQWYTKIGRIVTAYFYMYNFSDTSSSTHVRINGLPYANNNARESSFHISTGGNPSLGSGSIGVFGRIGVTGNTTQITLYRGFATTTASMTHAQLNSGHYYATFQYATDA